MSEIFSEAIFSPDFDLSGVHLVAASAGTGKTYNIQNIYVRLVVESGLRVEQIQVMTFTEAATKELRDRIRRVLLAMSRFLAGDVNGMKEEELARLEKLRACARARLPQGGDGADALARSRVELALMEFDQAAISTIHGFCRRILARFAFETNSAFATEFEDTKLADLRLRVRDWWRRERSAVDPAVRDQLDLVTLQKDVGALAGKADWQIDTTNADQPEGILLKTAKTLVEAYEAARPLRKTQTFDDLLHAVREALQHEARGPELAKRLRTEFKAVLVDEFQDTDPVQYDIFRYVFLSDETASAVYFVGDPKQAIYSFRGGDIYTYKAAVTRPDVADRTFRLDRNFRSTPRLIDAVNALFKDVANDDGTYRRTFGDDAIPYEQDLAASTPKALQVEGKDDPAPFRLVSVERASDRTDAVVDSVLKVLAEQPGLSPKSIAILVSSHAAGQDLRKALREKRVPAVLQKAGNVFAGETALELYDVLQAMALMGGQKQIRTALMSNFFSFTPEEIDAAAGDVFADMVGFFGELNGIWLRRGFNAAMAALEKHPKCDFRRRFAGFPDGERRLSDIFQIIDLANAAIQVLGPTPHALVGWVTERINLSGEMKDEEDAEEYARQLESEDDAVRIMTIHVSKGLEFPVVIVPLSSGRNIESPYFFHDENGRLIASTDPSAKPKAKSEQVAERLRLLYVALTRASQRTIVVAAESLFESDPALSQLVANARAHQAGETDAGSPIQWLSYEKEDLPDYVRKSVAAAEWIDAETPRSYSLEPTRGSYSTLSPASHESDAAERDYDAEDQTSSVEGDCHAIFKMGGGTKIGIAWHEIFEKIPYDADAAAIRLQTENSLRLNGVLPSDAAKAEEDVTVVSDMVAATLNWELTSPTGERFTLRDVGMSDHICEWEFDFSSASAVDTTATIAAILREEWAGDVSKSRFLACLDNWDKKIPKGFLKGFLDLVFRKNGYYYVVDWKSNVLTRSAEGFSAEGVVDEMARAGYFWQYLLYSVVLQRYLKETMGAQYSWERHFGGIRYYFLRGVAAGGEAPVFADRPSEKLLTRLSVALGLEEA